MYLITLFPVCLLYMKISLWCLYLLFTREMVCSVLFDGCDSIPY